MNKHMIIGIILIAFGIIIMANLVRFVNYFIQKGRTQKGEDQTKAIISKQDSVKNDVIDSVNKSSSKVLDETSQIKSN